MRDHLLPMLLAVALVLNSFCWVQGSPLLVFPQFANGESAGFLNKTRIILRNNSPQAMIGRIVFAGGLEVPINGGVHNEIEFEIGSWGTIDFETDGTGSLMSGAVEVWLEEGNGSLLVGTEVFSILGDYVSVEAFKPIQNAQIYVSLNEAENTGLAVYNPNPDEAYELTLILLDSQGDEAARKTVTIDPKAQLLAFVDEIELFEEILDVESTAFFGTLNISANGEIAVLGLLQRSTGELIATSPSEHAFIDAPVGEEKTLGFIGCSQTSHLTQGLVAIGGLQSWDYWGSEGNGLRSYGGCALNDWYEEQGQFGETRTNDLHCWHGFNEKQVAKPADVIWIELCVRDVVYPTETLPVSDVDQGVWLIEELRRKAPTAEILISGMNTYDPQDLCPRFDLFLQRYGYDRPSQSWEIAEAISSQTGVTFAHFQLGPLTPEMVAEDFCHANDDGKAFQAEQLRYYLEGPP